MNVVLVGYSMVWGQSPPACSVAAAAPAQLPLLWSLARVPLACRFLGATGTLALPSAWPCKFSVSRVTELLGVTWVRLQLLHMCNYSKILGKEEGDLGIWFPWENEFLDQNSVWAERYLQYLGIPAARSCARSHYSATFQGDVFPSLDSPVLDMIIIAFSLEVGALSIFFMCVVPCLWKHQLLVQSESQDLWLIAEQEWKLEQELMFLRQA